MECRETQTLLTAFHDGELPAADRARVEDHLRGCPECGARLSDLARADRAAGVPDPGPAYWDRFNARVMDRVAREADGPRAAVLRPKGGWMRQQLRYLVPAVAAAALVVMVVHYGGMHPAPPTPNIPPAVSERAAPVPGGERGTKAEPEIRATKKTESTAVARSVPPPVLDKERSAAVTREGRDRLDDRSLPAGNEGASREGAVAPSAIGVPSPSPLTTLQRAPAGSSRDTAADGMLSRVEGERKKMAEAAAPMAERRVAGEEKSTSGAGLAKGPSEEGGPSPFALAPSRVDSPCEMARSLTGRERFREAEEAQRACLAGDLDAPSREKGLVFLAELLDRQARFSEADAVIAEVDRRFPQSRPLDLYRQLRPTVQKQPKAVPVNR